MYPLKSQWIFLFVRFGIIAEEVMGETVLEVSRLESASSLGRYVFGSEISYNKAPPRLPGLGC